MIPRQISRRELLKIGAGCLFLSPGRSVAQTDSVCLGVIADLHHGLEPRAMERLETFMRAVAERKPDAILQLGDFNFGTKESEECLDLWNSFKGPGYHVLGNHDMDFVSKDAIVQKWGMPARYYSFDFGPYHVVVLDRNNLKTDEGYTPYSEANFYVDASLRGYADDAQLAWLRDDLAKSALPIVVFVHQGLGLPTSMPEASSAIEAVLEEHNSNVSDSKVVACFCGHHHIDRHTRKNGIHYLWINSASYYWVGAEYGRMAPYTHALYTFIIFRSDGLMEIEACHADWVAPSPADRGFPGAGELTPFISARRLEH
ncbi:MAG: metallophosphoesterase [Rhodothermaceae bacterium]|nr:metallophosphoesterase [Rhodothermaceae bacterium]MYE62806.1 metallophosphoesterase [Rhodothermaceae bacterium]MYJ20114.1 metallophosphoesterase [Rhodothermaceae bacterium]